jgi:hypothetical protein
MARPEKRGASLPANEQPASKKPKEGPSDEVYIDLTSNGPWQSVPIIIQDQPAREDPVYDTCFGLVFPPSHFPLAASNGVNAPSSSVCKRSPPRDVMGHLNASLLG